MNFMLEWQEKSLTSEINLIIIWRRVFYWKLNHSQIPYATSSGTRVAYFPYITFVSVISLNDIRFVSYIVLKFVGVSSKHLRVFLGSLRKSSDIFGFFGNPRKMFGNIRLEFGTILENLRKSSEGGLKSSENHQKRRHQHVCIIKRTLHGGLKI